MSELEPPPDELKALFDAERAAPLDPGARSTLRSRLAASIGLAQLGTAAAGTVLGGAGKAIVLVAITIAAGTGGAIALRHTSSSASAPIRTTHVIAPASAPRVEAAIAVTPPPPDPIAAPLPPPKAAPMPSAESEPTLLQHAWSALSAGDAAVALHIAEQDARVHPGGPLGEERDALEISALSKLHRDDDAHAAATRFLAQYPASVHRALVEQALHSEETP